MTDARNYRLIAVQVGDMLKYDTSIKEVGRVAGAIFRFQRESFPNSDISSERAQLVYDWILSLARQHMSPEERNRLLVTFCEKISPDSKRGDVLKVLHENGVPLHLAKGEETKAFYDRNFHPAVVQHCRSLYLQGNYFHAVFEACKVYNSAVKEKAMSTGDGEPLMMQVWSPQSGVLKLTPCLSETDRNVQDGMKFLSSGLMRAVRNPTAHEPALDWPILREDCLDLLSFISFLFRQLDKAVYFKGGV